MSKAYIAGVGKHLPNAEITFDGFHVIQLANAAVDEVRRAEVRDEPVLRHTRWVWLKDGWRWTKRQLNDFHHLSRTRLKTARAWRLKNALRELYAQAPPREMAEAELKRWYRWARRCRLAPFKRLALTINAHWHGPSSTPSIRGSTTAASRPPTASSRPLKREHAAIEPLAP